MKYKTRAHGTRWGGLCPSDSPRHSSRAAFEWRLEGCHNFGISCKREYFPLAVLGGNLLKRLFKWGTNGGDYTSQEWKKASMKLLRSSRKHTGILNLHLKQTKLSFCIFGPNILIYCQHNSDIGHTAKGKWPKWLKTKQWKVENEGERT